MDLRVIGCHGGETPRHRTSAFILDDRLAIDAGSLTSGVDIKGQCALEAVVVSHAHLDHVRDLAHIADNRSQNDCKPLIVAGTAGTIDILKKHFFNDKLWPDFTKIPNASRPTIKLVSLKPNVVTKIAGYSVRPVAVHHTIECCGFLIEGKDGSIAYSGDTGPTKQFWQVLNDARKLKALILEVSFPNAKQKVATLSGHHTPKTLALDLAKYKSPKDLPTLLFHIKPNFQREVERECARLKGLNLTVLGLGDQFIL